MTARLRSGPATPASPAQPGFRWFQRGKRFVILGRGAAAEDANQGGDEPAIVEAEKGEAGGVEASHDHTPSEVPGGPDPTLIVSGNSLAGPPVSRYSGRQGFSAIPRTRWTSVIICAICVICGCHTALLRRPVCACIPARRSERAGRIRHSGGAARPLARGDLPVGARRAARSHLCRRVQ